MAMIYCKECNKPISKKAKSCPHCGHSERNSAGCWLFFLLIFLTFVGYMMFGNHDSGYVDPSQAKTVDVSITVSTSEITFTNRGSPEAVGKVMDVILDSVTGYRGGFIMPEVGKSVSEPLNSFVRSNGERFDGRSRRPREVWVGGSGYDYKGFGF